MKTIATPEEPIPGGLIEGLLDDYAPAEESFEVALPKGQKLRFRRLSDQVEMSRIQREAVQWAKSFLPQRKGEEFPIPEAWKDVYVPDALLLARVYCIASLALEPDLQNKLNVMRLARKAGPIFETISSQIDKASANLIEAETEAMDEQKKG